MKGLIIKDFLGMKGFFRIFIIIIAICVIPVIVSQQGEFSGGFASGICTFIGGMMCFTSFAYDKAYGWDTYVLTLPYTRKQIVLSKYLFSLLITGIGAGIGLIVNLILTATGLAHMDADTWTIIGLLGCMVLLFNSVTIPLMFRFDPEKTRVIVIVIFLVPFMLLALLGGGDPNRMMDTIQAVMTALPVVSIAALVVSWFVAAKVYETKEV